MSPVIAAWLEWRWLCTRLGVKAGATWLLDRRETAMYKE